MDPEPVDPERVDQDTTANTNMTINTKTDIIAKRNAKTFTEKIALLQNHLKQWEARITVDLTQDCRKNFKRTLKAPSEDLQRTLKRSYFKRRLRFQGP